MNSFHIPCLSWCMSSRPWWVGIAGFGCAYWIEVEPSPVPCPCGLGCPQPSQFGRRRSETPCTTFHNPNTSWWYGLLGVQMGITELSAAVLPGNLHLALTWAPGWLLHTCPGQACVCVDPSPSNQHTCRAHQPYVSSPHPLVATMAPPPGICREKIR